MDPLSAQLRYLGVPVIEGLLRLFDDGGQSRESPPLRLARALRDPAVVEAVLSRLPPDELAALSIAIDAGTMVARDVLVAEVERALGKRGERALVALGAKGLLLAAPDLRRVGLPDYVCEALVWFVPSAEPIRQAPAGEPETLRFDTAVILALLAESRPRVNRDGNVNVSDLRRVEKRLASSPRLSRRFELLTYGLLEARLLRAGDRVELTAGAAARHFARPPREAWGELVGRTLSSWALFRIYALCAAAGDGWVPAESLVRVVRLRSQAFVDPRDPSASLEEYAALLLLEETTLPSGERLYRAPQQEAAETGQLVVQPSFEVLAPPDTPPQVIAELGRFAELKNADRFASFRITEDSVQLAIDEGATVAELLQLLEAHAARGVPQNVALTLAGWTKVARRALLSEGLAIHFDDSAQREAAAQELGRERIAVSELGDRVLVVPTWERSRVKAVLRKLAVRVVERQSTVDGEARQRSGFWRPYERNRMPAEAPLLHARLRQRIAAPPAADATGRAAAESAAAASVAESAAAERAAAESVREGKARSRAGTPRGAPLKRMLERAVKTGESLVVRVHDRERVVRVERLRSRGASTYAEVVTIEGNEGLAMSLDDIIEARSLAASGPVGKAKR